VVKCDHLSHLTNEYLSALARRLEDPVAASAMKSADHLGTLLLNGKLPKWYHKIVAGAVVAPIMGKPEATDECRPVSAGDAFRCACVVQGC
jgi:hypothetical protein